MGCLDGYLPAVAMVAMQFTYAGVALSTRAALLQGMSPSVFVFYRQAIASLLMLPIAFITRRERACLKGFRSIGFVFVASLVGVTLNQNIYFEGIYLASSSMGSALFNLVPAITFIVAAIMGLEKINIRSVRSNAKIVGTVLCVVGAVAIVLLKGPKLLNSMLPPIQHYHSLLGSQGGNWLLGSLLLLGSSCCWSFWIIFQVPVTKAHPDHLSLSAWMCFMATIQSGIVALFLEPNLEAWTLNSPLELASVFYAGIVGSAISFFIQAWSISRRGPLYCAMFSPLATVTTTFFASILLHEEIYTGGVIGAIGVISGLYIVLWGKAKDTEDPKSHIVEDKIVETLVDDHQDSSANKIFGNSDTDLEAPLLTRKEENV